MDTQTNKRKPQLNFSYLRNELIDLRDYQLNIAKKCFGVNSLVVIPTGLGKTIIALFVAANALENSPPDSKIIVLAPTRPLINQHYETFLKLMDISSDNFSILTGQVNPTEREKEHKSKQILFYTPQTLRNDLLNERYNLKSACIVIFDESHRATGDYAYCQIADEYIEQNPDGIILGLTASPGSSDSKISVLCENLHVPKSNIFLRTRKDDDVKGYIKPMKVWKIGVDMTEIMSFIHQAIKNMNLERLNYLYTLGFVDSSENMNNTFRKTLISLNKKLLDIVKGDGDKTNAYKALSVNAQALRLMHMLSLVEAQGLDALLSYLKSMKQEASKQGASKALIRLASDYELNKIFYKLLQYEENNPNYLTHPKYNICRDIILKELNENSEARILVFSQLRDSVATITKKLKGFKPTIRPKRFVGQAKKSATDKGLTQKRQIEILDEFKNGTYNVLVSTNVAEEGLDIAEVDLVIFYDAVASEIRLIQRKGRTARFREGKVIILYCKGTSDEIYLHISLNRLKKMENTLKKNVKLTKNIKKEKSKQPNSSQIPANLDAYLTPTITISNNLPLTLGIRQFLSESRVQFRVQKEKFHITINKLGVQIISSRKLIKNESEGTLKIFINDFKDKFNVPIIIAEFISFIENFDNEKMFVKRKINEISQKYGLQIVSIDKKSELFILLKGFLDKALEK